MALKIDPWKPPGANEVELASVVALYRLGLAAQTPPEMRSSVNARAHLEEWFKVPKTAALLAKAMTGRVEGLLGFRIEAPVVRILYLAALEHRRGIGSQLLASLRDLCAKRGIKELRAVYSAKDVRAKSFLAKHGFKDDKPAGETVPGFPLMEAAVGIG